MTTFLCLAGLAILAALGYKKPNWGLSAILALLPTYLIRSQFAGIPVTLLECMVIGFAAGVAFSKPDWTSIKKLGKINYAILFFLLAAAISTAISPEKTRALGQLKAFFIEPVIFFYSAVLVLNQTGRVKPALQSLMLSSGLVAAFGFIQYFTFLWLPIRFWGTGGEPTRITSVFEYPNALALFLAPLLILFFVLFQKGYELFKYKWAYHWYFAASAIAIIMTMSRGAWAALLVVLALLVFKTKHRLSVAVGVVLVILLGSLFLPGAWERTLSSFKDGSSQEHRHLLIVGTNKILGSPVLGNGLAGFETTLSQSDFQGRPVSYPHNIFLNFWLEIGLLGLLSFAAILYIAMHRQGISPSVEALAAAAFLLVLVIHGLVDVPYFKNDLAVLFWFIISLFYIKSQTVKV